MKIHIVQKGDTLWKIAKKYGVNFEELKKMNTQLSNPDMIMPGMKIKIPTASGSIKKEAPMSSKSMGVKKETQMLQHPFAKEKPKEMPIEMPEEAPIAEAPMPEAPKPTPPEAPIQVPPKKAEVPKKPFVPKMPKPIIPEIDIHNYYMMNMANVNVEKEELKPQTAPQLPPKPMNILPYSNTYHLKDKSDSMEESSIDVPIKGGTKADMYPNQPPFYPVSPQMPGHGGVAPQYGPTFPQGMMPQGQPYGGMPGVEFDYDDESSSYMPNMPNMPHMPNQPAPVMGAYEDAQMPLMPNMPHPPMPVETGPAMQGGYPCPPYQGPVYPISPVLPGPGPIPAHTQGFDCYPNMPMPVQGVAESPDMHANLPHQMPANLPHQMPANLPHQMPAGYQSAPAMHGGDCGCGGPQVGSYGPPTPMYGPGSQGMHGFSPGMWGGAPGGYHPGMAGGFPQDGFGPYIQGGQQGFAPQGGGFMPGAPTGFNPYGGPQVGAGFTPNMPGSQGMLQDNVALDYTGDFAQPSLGHYGMTMAPVYTPPYGPPNPPYINPYGPTERDINDD